MLRLYVEIQFAQKSLAVHNICLGKDLRRPMSTLGFIEYEKASPEVRAVYDDIMATRKIDKVTNFWKALAHDPVRLKRVWEDTKEIMGAGALDPLVKELIYVAVSISNQC